MVDRVVHGRVAVDGRRRHHAPGPYGAPGLRQGPHPVGPLVQVVERAEQQHRVHARVRHGQVPGVAQPGRHPAQPRGVPHVERDRVEQLDLVAVGAQPLRVRAGPAADVEHPGRSRWQHPAQHVLGAPQLQPPAPLAEPGVLPVLSVVGEQLRCHGHT
nr:hypothetical protein [Nonomuraea phyllanthi]